MAGLIDALKRHLPGPIKAVLRPIYHLYLKATYKAPPKTYQDQLNDEVARFADEVEVNDLPEIFHYWSNKYLAPKLSKHGFNNPDEFFLKYAQQAIENSAEAVTILSIGAGNCDTEVALAKNLIEQGNRDFIIECMDINQDMFARGKQLALSQGVGDKITFLQADFNQWRAKRSYELIIANQSLHHVVELEHLFDQIKKALSEQGKFITSDVIGRNGHQRWPEAMQLLKPIWRKMPKKYKYNHAMQRQERTYINHDCSTEGFEGIRAQDVLPLLIDRFHFELFIPFANLILVFIDRNFGPNFDPNDAEDLAFIDQVHALDEAQMINGTIKPTQMLAVMTQQANSQTAYTMLSPEQALRLP